MAYSNDDRRLVQEADSCSYNEILEKEIWNTLTFCAIRLYIRKPFYRMDEKTKKIRELVAQLLELTGDEDGWYQKDGLTAEDIEEIKKLGDGGGCMGIHTKMLWYIIKCLDEIKDKLGTQVRNPIQIGGPFPWDPNNPPAIDPYRPYPYEPQPLGPTIWYSNPIFDPSAPVTAEYRDTEGKEMVMQPLTVTCTYFGRS